MCEGEDTCGHGYFCHTPQDSCIDDSDCRVVTTTPTGYGPVCAYDVFDHRWSCPNLRLPH
jgi:hypothetical protein